MQIRMAITLLLLMALAGFLVAAPLEMWQGLSGGSPPPPIVTISLSREQYVAAKVQAWRQFMKAKKHCDGLDGVNRDLCLQQATHERAVAIDVVNTSYSDAKAD